MYGCRIVIIIFGLILFLGCSKDNNVSKEVEKTTSYSELQLRKDKEVNDTEREESEHPIATNADEMLKLYEGNRDAAYSKYDRRSLTISNCKIRYIGNGVIICEGIKASYHHGILVANAKDKIPNYLDLRKGDVITLNGKVISMDEAIGTSTFWGNKTELYGFTIELK